MDPTEGKAEGPSGVTSHFREALPCHRLADKGWRGKAVGRAHQVRRPVRDLRTSALLAWHGAQSPLPPTVDRCPANPAPCLPVLPSCPLPTTPSIHVLLPTSLLGGPSAVQRPAVSTSQSPSWGSSSQEPERALRACGHVLENWGQNGWGQASSRALNQTPIFDFPSNALSGQPSLTCT